MSNGIINSFIKGLENIKISTVSKFSGDFNISDEVCFIDDGYIQSAVSRLKKEIERIDNDIANTSGKNMQELQKQKADLKAQLAFYLSNDFAKIEECLTLIGEHEFRICLEGLLCYKQKKIEEAFLKFHQYLKSDSGIKLINHYLVNRAYGTILANNKQERLATVVLSVAVKLRPDDLLTHKMLYQLYQQLGDINKQQREKEIIELLS